MGRPAWFMAIRPAFEPPSSESTTPTETSFISAGSREGLEERVCLRTVERSSSG